MQLKMNDPLTAESPNLVSVVQKKIFTAEDCQKIINFSEKNMPHERATTGEAASSAAQAASRNLRDSVIRWIWPINANKQLYELIRREVVLMNKHYWNYHLSDFYEPMQFTQYDAPNGHFTWHIDIGPNKRSFRKISIVVQLSEPDSYEGGELEVLGTDQDLISKERGNAIFFPSFLAHKVHKVTKGRRYSLVLWFSGPSFS